MLALTAACGGSHDGADNSRAPMTHLEIMAALAHHDTVKAHNPHEARLDSMPGRDCVKMKINLLPGGTLGRTFNDSNYLHIAEAEAIGVRPITSLGGAWTAGARLERVITCEDYYIDDLTHSMPYLVPEAKELLGTIGRAFRDSLAARGGRRHLGAPLRHHVRHQLRPVHLQQSRGRLPHPGRPEEPARRGHLGTARPGPLLCEIRA
mgnify:CR=1 FL=1